MFSKKNKNSALIGAVAGFGVFAVATAVAFKVNSMIKEKIASEFDDYYCPYEDDEGENIYIYDGDEDTENRYQDTLTHRRDRVNKRRPLGIRGEKYY